MIDAARAGPVLIEKHGRGVVVVISLEECERLSAQSGRADKGLRKQMGRRKASNGAFAWSEIEQPLKGADWALVDGRSARFEYTSDGCKAGYSRFDCQGRAFVALEAKTTTSVNQSEHGRATREAQLWPFKNR